MQGGSDIVGPIGEAFRARIGEDRHDVWFGGTTRVVAGHDERGELVVTLVAGTPLTHAFIQRSFRGEFAAAVREALGSGTVRIEVVPDEISPPTVLQAEKPLPVVPPARRGRRQVPQPIPSAPFPASASASPPVPPAGRSPSPTALVPRPVSVAAPAAPVGGRAPLSLEGFVVGDGNRMALAAVEMAAARPGAMSPLLLHGPSGVGKTHLLEGIGRRVREAHPRAGVVTVSAEQFTTTFLEALHGKRGLPGFRRSLRGADLLVVDDIHFFAGKKATVSELLHTLDALHRSGKQVVFSADREVEALGELGEEFLTRLRGGMAVRIQPPDETTRRGIVAALAGRRGLALPDEVVRFVAGCMTRDTRELAGAVNRLEATAAMLGIPIDLPMARSCLADLVRSSTRAVRLADVERAVCQAFGLEPSAMQSSCRARRVNQPRILAMFLARKHTHAALAEIGRHFGRRSHSTVLSAKRTVDNWLASGATLTLADAEWGVEEALRRVEETLRVG